MVHGAVVPVQRLPACTDAVHEMVSNATPYVHSCTQIRRMIAVLMLRSLQGLEESEPAADVLHPHASSSSSDVTQLQGITRDTRHTLHLLELGSIKRLHHMRRV